MKIKHALQEYLLDIEVRKYTQKTSQIASSIFKFVQMKSAPINIRIAVEKFSQQAK